MPKQTFYNLPEEKQETLIAAAKKEFSRAPLYEASISNIIKTAEIPRGSFYQYFEDKDDLFFFILDGFSTEVRNQMIASLQESKGDLFYAFTEMYKYFLLNFKSKENLKFFRNAFLNMNHKIEKTFAPSFCKERGKEKLIEFINLIDITKLNILNKEEVSYVLQVLMAITMHNIIQNFARELSFEEALKTYTIEINMIKRGICKGEY